MKERKDQLIEIFSVLSFVQSGSKERKVSNHMFKYSLCGSGKTVNLQVIVVALAKSSLKIALVMPNPFLMSRMREDLISSNLSMNVIQGLFKPGESE